MNFSIELAYITAALTFGIAVLTIFRDPRSFIHKVFALGMFLIATGAGFLGFAHQASSPESFIFRLWLHHLVLSFVPACWLYFSLAYARTDYREEIVKWRWLLFAALAIPISSAVLFKNAFFTGLPIETGSGLFVMIGLSGYIWHLCLVISAIVILMNLEKTFRQATGHMRWQTKFMFLGIGSIFGIHLFTSSQTLLFRGIDTGLLSVDIGAILLADLLILRSFFRGKPLAAKVHLSHQVLYNSFTALIVGIYFIIVAVMAWISFHFDWVSNFHVIIFLIFTAIVGISAILLSDRLRLKRKRFISKHFKRPQYDYQKIWETFTQQTITITQSSELCTAAVKMVSETLEILAVTIWLIDEERETLTFGGSTVLTWEQAAKANLPGAADIIETFAGESMPIDLSEHSDQWAEDLKNSYGPENTKESGVRYCVPLNAAGSLVGIMTLSEKVFYESLSFEDLDLVRSMADQVAAGLLNIRLSEKLRQMKELEAFQAMSAFFIHDLKNLASKLSLVTQNLPLHMDNPEFRTDALKTMSQSVDKINGMSRRLSLLSEKLNLKIREADLNEFVDTTVTGLNGVFNVPIQKNLGTVPALHMDPDEMRKVLENLIINAMDAVGQSGEVVVSTGIQQDKWALFSVSDNGCGIKKEFLERDLFRPFRTTKQKGMGIGLFHCKTIVEAHGGKMEVQSEEGAGATFRVLLPIKQ